MERVSVKVNFPLSLTLLGERIIRIYIVHFIAPQF
jgi:hypothetical protein